MESFHQAEVSRLKEEIDRERERREEERQKWVMEADQIRKICKEHYYIVPATRVAEAKLGAKATSGSWERKLDVEAGSGSGSGKEIFIK